MIDTLKGNNDEIMAARGGVNKNKHDKRLVIRNFL